MSTERAVTILLGNGETATVPEPAWCTTSHDEQVERLADVLHEGPEIGFTVRTPYGFAESLQAALGQFPFASDPELRVPAVTVLVGDSWERFSPAGVVELADGLVVYAGRLRALGVELAAILAAGR
ncbi:hypothetical protein [Streptomyces sp. CB03911]|uniref:DUF6907 domain-containing protein n=1 Tax=Streptomyces sp. CB03911 TaxID=1804758 RepID=UPI00093A6238|nr:hypothetical protein [Streptomyces sp. CB03911]OKI14216.1 hypothetical protein A6A07_13785 [Streptomyces sp. CB03911]